jgi:hypothetical protein
MIIFHGRTAPSTHAMSELTAHRVAHSDISYTDHRSNYQLWTTHLPPSFARFARVPLLSCAWMRACARINGYDTTIATTFATSPRIKVAAAEGGATCAALSQSKTKNVIAGYSSEPRLHVRSEPVNWSTPGHEIAQSTRRYCGRVALTSTFL